MKDFFRDRVNRSKVVAAVLGSLGWAGLVDSWGQTPAALPQPDLVFYGSVVQSPLNNEVTPATLSWTISGNSETITASDTTIVVINSQTFYITRVPVEVRSIAGGPTLAATADTLELTSTNTAYTRTVSVDYNAVVREGETAPGEESFSYGVPSQGLVDNVDLVIGETFEEWSQRIFGMLVDPNGDADGDGETNVEEYLAGTDPQSSASRLRVLTFVPAGGGGFEVTWNSIDGKKYSVEKSSELAPDTWTTVATEIAGTGSALSFIYATAMVPGRMYYRIVVSDD